LSPTARKARGANSADLLTRVTAEIEARRDQLRAAVQEYEQLLNAGEALEQETAATAVPAAPATAARSPRKAPRALAPKVTARAKAPTTTLSADQQAILAALEHGSHSVGELTVVTAIAAPAIREAGKGLVKAGRVTRTTRDGKAAYALAG
jgi:hypothetical protein